MCAFTINLMNKATNELLAKDTFFFTWMFIVEYLLTSCALDLQWTDYPQYTYSQMIFTVSDVYCYFFFQRLHMSCFFFSLLNRFLENGTYQKRHTRFLHMPRAYFLSMLTLALDAQVFRPFARKARAFAKFTTPPQTIFSLRCYLLEQISHCQVQTAKGWF